MDIKYIVPEYIANQQKELYPSTEEMPLNTIVSYDENEIPTFIILLVPVKDDHPLLVEIDLVQNKI